MRYPRVAGQRMKSLGRSSALRAFARPLCWRPSAVQAQQIAGVGTVPNIGTHEVQDPGAYSSGRWLRHDWIERAARFVEFDFERLCEKVLQVCHDAHSIKSWEKKEGGYNKAFIFTLDNARRVVARFPTQISGPTGLTTHSEVATINYLQSSTKIPIPKILAWSDNTTNSIGAEYIIMEHANGCQLHDRWPEMSIQQRIACVAAIVRCVAQMAAVKSDVYGSIYFDSLDIDETLKTPFAPGYVVGPHCGSTYWDCDIREPRYYGWAPPNRGPWLDLASYCSALIDIGLSRLPHTDEIQLGRPWYHGSVEEHKRILNAARQLLETLVQSDQLKQGATPTLLHSDLHMRNIFVSSEDPTIVTGIIDWQSSSINPAFMYADTTPDFASVQSRSGSDAPLSTMQSDLHRQAYYAGIRLLAPKLYSGLALDDDLARFFEYCHRTFRDGAGVFRDILFDMAEKVGKSSDASAGIEPGLKLERSPCHEKEYKALEQAQELKRFVVERLNTTTDGWVPSSNWEGVSQDHKELYSEFLQRMPESELREVWPFDVPL